MPKSGYRFSENIMLQQEVRAGWRFEEKPSRSSEASEVGACVGRRKRPSVAKSCRCAGFIAVGFELSCQANREAPMPREFALSLDSLIKDELDGKASAIARYDDIIWKIRTGYAVILYGAVGIVAGLANQLLTWLRQRSSRRRSSLSALAFSVLCWTFPSFRQSFASCKTATSL